MIKVMVVEDDKLVRNGLISTMPWQKFDMKVAGEAKNGEKALEFLASNPVDLLLTDLAMPVMSGLELMRIIRQRYPDIFVVVLSLHQDFEYIQEALRIGAIDYIAKVELDQACMEEILGRIHGRILAEQKKSSELYKKDGDEVLAVDEGFLIIAIDDDLDRKEMEGQRPAEYRLVVLGSDLHLWLPKNEREPKQLEDYLEGMVHGKTGVSIIHVKGLKGKRISDMQSVMMKYKEKGFFYDYHPNRTLLPKTVQDLQAPPHVLDEDGLADIKAQLLSLDWIHHASTYEHVLTELKNMHLAIGSLTNLLYLVVNEWNRIYYPITSEQIDLPDEFSSWVEVVNWFNQMRTMMIDAVGKPHLSEEVRRCIAKAVHCIHEEFVTTLHASDMADRVNLSRSYFSQCFKEVVGMTFNEYVRQVRIDKAKDYLLHTDKKVWWIAENTGYMDGKYFSRIFRDKTGLLPSEYRQKNKAGGEMFDEQGGKC